MKKHTLEELFEQILNGQEEPSFKQDDILSKMNKVKENGEPVVVLSVQDNTSEKPWEPHVVNGEAVAFVVHQGDGEFHAGIVGALSNHEAAMMLEAIDDLKENLLKQMAARMAERLFNKLKGE